MGFFTDLTDGLGLTSYAEQSAAMARARSLYENMSPPEIKALQLEQVGNLSPTLINAITSEGSAFEDISIDPRLKQAQTDALASFQEIADEGGLTASDRAMLGRIASQERTQERGQREAIMQQAQMRGVGGSGLELAQKLQAQQGAASRQAMRDQEIAALAEQRKMQALQQAGQLGGQMRSQEFGEQSQVAQARDLMERFNLSNRQQAEMANVAARNQAQQYNLATAQDLANKREMWMAGAPQQQFQNQMAINTGLAGADSAYANMLGQQSAANLQMAGNLAIAGAKATSDRDVKENVSMAPNEIDDFLNELTGYKFTYEDPEKYGEKDEPQIGVMAQDMEKSKMGKEAVFESGDGTKMIDGGDALGPILASLGRLNEKINSLEEEDGRV